MNFDDYNNTVPYPELKGKPRSPRGGSSDEYAEYAKDLRKWEKFKEGYDEEVKAYRAEERNQNNRFKADALKDVGLEGHVTAEKAYEMAWARGHSEGYYRVHDELEDLAELILFKTQVSGAVT